MSWDDDETRAEIEDAFGQLDLPYVERRYGYGLTDGSRERLENERDSGITAAEMALILAHNGRAPAPPPARYRPAHRVDPLDVLLFGGDVGLERGRIVRDGWGRDRWPERAGRGHPSRPTREVRTAQRGAKGPSGKPLRPSIGQEYRGRAGPDPLDRVLFGDDVDSP
jgi:hypothetical protein